MIPMERAMSAITPLILCGGTGSRLWPLSRRASPKQFQPTAGAGSPSFLQATLQRHRSDAFGTPLIVTGAAHVDLVRAQLRQIQCTARVIGESIGRNTGPAVLAGALDLLSRDPDGLLLVVPADHLISGDLDGPIGAMVAEAEAGRIVSFGITPTRPETGFGYLLDGGPVREHPGLHTVERFIEKPPFPLARALTEGGRAYWASGLSLFRADTLVAEYDRLEPATVAAVRAALAAAVSLPDGLLLPRAALVRAEAAPTERAVFERSDRVALAPLEVEWNDVGSWLAVHATALQDDAGNALTGDVIAVETRGSLVQGSDRLVAVVGLEDVVVVDTPDAVLVSAREKTQLVKEIVARIDAAGRPETVRHRRMIAEWGETEDLPGPDNLAMSVTTLHAGASRTLPPEPGAVQLVAVDGDVWVENDAAPAPLRRGASLVANGAAGIELRNSGLAPAKILALRVLSPEPRADHAKLEVRHA